MATYRRQLDGHTRREGEGGGFCLPLVGPRVRSLYKPVSAQSQGEKGKGQFSTQYKDEAR